MPPPDFLHPAPFGSLFGTYLGRVLDVADPDNLGRVQVRLLTTPDTVGDADAAIWARVAVPFAGDNRGAFFLPDVGDEVAIVFVGGDPRQPLVVGGLWNGAAKAPEALGSGGNNGVDRYAIVSKKGSRIAIVEETDGAATITFSTPANEKITITQSNGGKIEIEAVGNTITVDTQGVSVQTSSKVKVSASQVEVTAGTIKVDAAMSTFSGMVKCDVLKATTVIGTTYTPGAGNVW